MISLCLTHYNRPSMLWESFRQLIDDDRVSEIVIVDDHSSDELYNTVVWQTKAIGKIKLFRNEQNVGCYHNKKIAVSCATNDFVIIGDSDNVFDKAYVDALFESRRINGSWLKEILLQPEYGMPHFDWTMWRGHMFDRKDVASEIDSLVAQMFNAMNYFVHREEYLRVWEDREEPWTADSLLQNYNWIKNGNSIFVCPDLRYTHRVHSGSHYVEHNKKTGNLYEELIEKFKQLK